MPRWAQKAPTRILTSAQRRFERIALKILSPTPRTGATIQAQLLLFSPPKQRHEPGAPMTLGNARAFSGKKHYDCILKISAAFGCQITTLLFVTE